MRALNIFCIFWVILLFFISCEEPSYQQHQETINISLTGFGYHLINNGYTLDVVDHQLKVLTTVDSTTIVEAVETDSGLKVTLYTTEGSATTKLQNLLPVCS